MREIVGHLEIQFFSDGAALFDRKTWKTHVLSASSALLLRATAMAFNDGVRSAESLSRFLQESLELPADAPDLKELLAFLRSVELID